MTDCGTLEVVSSFSASAIQTTSCPEPNAINPGETTTLNVEVENRNSVPANATIEITDGSGNVLGSRTISISAETSRSYGVTITAPSSYGSYSLTATSTNESEDTSATATMSLSNLSELTADRKSLAVLGTGLAGGGLAAYKSR